MTTSFLSDQTREVVLGGLLGDGSLRIHHPYRNARYSFRHSIAQQDYFFWKVKLLEEVSSTACWWRQEKNGLGGVMLRYQSVALPALTELYRLTHEGNKLTIRRRWLNRLSPLSLAIWWLDDGSIVTNGRRGVFCTDPFPEAEVKLLQRYLLVVWNIRTTVGKISRIRDGIERSYFRLWIRSSEELIKLFRIILPFVKAPSMLPKVMLLYRDSELQQRWISEVSKATGFPEDIVTRYALEKKSRWKNFRK